MQFFCLCRCQVKGTGQQLTVGQPVMLTLHTADAYSNACWDSADKVHVGLCGPPGTGLTAAAVKDLRNGAYGISFTPDVAGRWTVLPRYFVQRLEKKRKRQEKTTREAMYTGLPSVQRLAKIATSCSLGMAQTRWGQNMADLAMLHMTRCGCRSRYCHECACLHQSLQNHSMKLAESACYHSMQACKLPCMVLPCCLSPDHTEWL